MCSKACRAEDSRRRHGHFNGPKKPPRGRDKARAKAHHKVYGPKYYQQNKDRIIALRKARRAANPEAWRAQALRDAQHARARKRNAAGTFTREQLDARRAYYGGLCWIPGCGRVGCEIDHVIALARGGSNWPANLRPMCRYHNRSKRDRDWREFLASAT